MTFEKAQPYDQVVLAAVGFLDEAIALAEQYDFTIPADWMATPADVSTAEFIQIANSYAARFLAKWPRYPAEAATVDWQEVLDRANAGIQNDFGYNGDNVTWWAEVKFYLENIGWARADLMNLGAAGSDTASNNRWLSWLGVPPPNRNPFSIDTDDERFPAYPHPSPPPENLFNCTAIMTRTDACSSRRVWPDAAWVGTPGYLEYRSPTTPFRADRGSYHFSGYGDFRYYEQTYEFLVGWNALFNLSENELLKAEAYINLGSPDLAVPLINLSREANGRLAAVTTAGAPEAAGRCTPRDKDGNCADLFEALKYEKRMENYVTSQGQSFYDARGWGELVSWSPVQWPVPARELLILLANIYTFGGDCSPNAPEECGSAPDISASVASAGGLRPLRPGEVPTAEDIAARVQLFKRINASLRHNGVVPRM
jgi:hypothetical protein